jgi:lysophospholipase L1-like esterase
MPEAGSPTPERSQRRPALVVAVAVVATLAIVGVTLTGPGAGAQTSASSTTRPPSTLATTSTTASGASSTATTRAATGTTGTTTASRPLRIRAFGDSITAGYGFFSDGTEWGVTQLLSCRPPAGEYNDRCSSNSTLGPDAPAGQPVFSADFGLGNGVAWPAQVAKALGTVDYANYAVTGSEPADWMNLAPEPDAPDNGYLHDLLVRLENDDPDLVLMTLGANPLLSDFLTGPGMACSLFDDEATQRQLFLDCIDGIISDQLVSQRLIATYIDVLAHTGNAKILVSRYYLALPAITLFDEWQGQLMVDQVNAQVDKAVASVQESGANFAERIAISQPARFDSGWPGTGQDATCGATQPADGPSRQAFVAQVMLAARAGSAGFCPSADPWIIDGDTGIHPDRDGHAQLAAAALGVIRANGWQVPPD